MRKKITHKRAYPLDPVYGNALIGRFINQVMRQGKKSTAQRLVYDAFRRIEEKQKQDPVLVFEAAIKNVAPDLEVRSKRVGGANYQVPVEVSPVRRSSLAVRWIIDAAMARPEKVMKERLGNEIMDASKNTGVAVKRREDMHKMAEANKAFVHFKW